MAAVDPAKGCGSGDTSEDGASITRLLACLERLQSVPGRDIKHARALRGLAAIGHDIAPAVGDDSQEVGLSELEILLRDAGRALSSLAGHDESGEACAALQYLSFRCFCAVDVLRQATSGVDVGALPRGDAVWGPILEAWDSAHDGCANVDTALEGLARWWTEREGRAVYEAGTVGCVVRGGDGEVAVAAALASVRQQAEWLRGGAAGELKSEAAAAHLDSAVTAVEELRSLLKCGVGVAGGRLKALPGLDLAGGVACRMSKDCSVYLAQSRIIPDAKPQALDVEHWAACVAAGAGAMSQSVSAVMRAEALRVASGLPKLEQIPLNVSLEHRCAGGGPDDPVGVQGSVDVQVQCEAGWPLRKFVEDGAWTTVNVTVKQRLAVKVLGVYAVAEACGVELGDVGVGSFVVGGVEGGSVGDLVEALDGGGCEVVLSACCRAWCDEEVGGCVSDVLEAVAGAREGGATVDGWLADAVRLLQAGAPGCCMAAYSSACASCSRDVACMASVDAEVNAWMERQGVKKEVAGEEDGGFIAACRDGDVSKVRELLALSGAQVVDVHVGDEDGPEAGFRAACEEGHTAVVRELLALTGHREVDVHAGPEGWPDFGFQVACQNGHVAIVRELLALTGHREVDVHAGPEGWPDFGFQVACRVRHVDVVRELLALTGRRAVPLRTRLRAGKLAARAAKGAVWDGTSTRRGRKVLLLLRALHHEQL